MIGGSPWPWPHNDLRHITAQGVQVALLANAAGVALCTRLRECAQMLGVALLDFLIVGDGRSFFIEAGR